MDRHVLEKLQQYSKSDYYPLHMPGHKRRISHFEQPFAIDITEIDGFDNLHHAQGILLGAQKQAAKLYGAEETYYLVNGSTCGILVAVSASVTRGGRILMARNSHKASYHAGFLNGLRVTYLYPRMDMRRGINGSIRPEDVRMALLEHSDIQAVLITSPTYDGIVSNIQAIAQEAHRAGAVLIVDEAHGAHFGMHSYFPKSALACGADIVINSLHKTLPSLTQTALLHVQGERADREKLRKYLGIYQSSSPSYVLMAGMDACVDLLQTQGEELFASFTQKLEQMRRSLQQMKTLHLVDGQETGIEAYDFDRSKVLISLENCTMSGPELAQILREKYHLEPEMEAAHYVTAIMTVADTQEGFDRLTAALLEIDAEAEIKEESTERIAATFISNKEVMSIEKAENSPQEEVLLAESAGRISAEYVYLYPPGIPLLVPGERISEELVRQLDYYQIIGLELQGIVDYTGEKIRVIKFEF